ncbi:MAG TPA: MEDS domain-containing protein [Flavobacteriales bacterium]|nr:MEDS domain-containing protein [Flavobacteriales bacterium]
MTKHNWKQVDAREFWGKIAPAEHLVQVYDSKEIFLETLTGFVGTGINAGDSVIIIATSKNLGLLYDRLIGHGININSLISENKFIPLNAEEALNTFMHNGMPNPDLFDQLIGGLYAKALKGSKKVRAFGELVALLWENGNRAGSVKLESLWDHFCRKNALTLFCAYEKSLFKPNTDDYLDGLCLCHTKVIAGDKKINNAVRYRNTDLNLFEIK